MKDSFAEALQALDDALSKREEKINRLNAEYDDGHGKILERDYSDYHRRIEHVQERFRQKALDAQANLEALCVRARKRQPELHKLSPENIPDRSYPPQRILFGKVLVRYEGERPWEAYIPCQMPFPFPRPLRLGGGSPARSSEQVSALALRLLYTLPVGKILLHIADPQGMGSSVSPLKPILDCPEILPEKKFLRTPQEIGDCLENALSYAENLIQKVFPIGCDNWLRYNRTQWENHAPGSVLPCHVFVFLDLPHGVDETVMKRLIQLAVNGARCGCVILFSCDESAMDKREQYAPLDRKETLLQTLLLNSVPLDQAGIPQNASFRWLRLTRTEEAFPSRQQYTALLEAVKDAAKRAAASGTDFSDLSKGRTLFDADSAKGLDFPVGFDAETGAPLEIHLNDDCPHYLIGGKTGKGKSNFLHVLIMSLCSRYSPGQVELYLMDFKDGVEFAKYAAPPLPHASLVAQAADVEYGANVLERLVQLKEERHALFKRRSVVDSKGFRLKFPGEPLPRIVVIVDEFQNLLGRTEFASEGPQKRAADALRVLAKEGRSGGIHLIFATQKLSDVDFSAVNTQFSGRIALPCPAEDSKAILNDMSNDEAAELRVPFAILNMDNGRKAENHRFKIPLVKDEKEEMAARTRQEIYEECRRQGFQTRTTVFSGLEFPVHPHPDTFRSEGPPVFRFGDRLTFPAAPLEVRLQAKRYNHLLICGENERFKRGLLRSLLLSAQGNSSVQQVIYIGERDLRDVGKPLYTFGTMKPWVMEWLDSEANIQKAAHSLVILDQCDPINELGYEYGSPVTQEAELFSAFMSRANQAECFCAAFYDRQRQANASLGHILDEFNHTVAFDLSQDETSALLGNVGSSLTCPPDRAFYANNKKIEGWFRPYVEAGNGRKKSDR